MEQNSHLWPEEALCSYLCDLKYEDLSEKTVHYTKLLFADYFASAAAGSIVNKPSNKIVSQVYKSIDPMRDCHVLYSADRLSGPNCAAVNAFLAHGADMDDGHRVMGGHPGAPVLSALLAAAEKESSKTPVSGKQLILAAVCGYEAMIRIGAAVQPEHVGKGFHATCTVGGAGAAVACAKLMNFDSARMRNALSLALVHASGLMTVTETAQSTKPLNASDGARTGYMCALFAKNGLIGPDNVLMSPKGFMHAFGGDPGRISFVLTGIGKDMAINGCYMKQYPTCRATHAGAEAMIALRVQIGDAFNIERIRLHIYPRAIGIAGDERNRVPQNGENAKFSLAFAVADAFFTGTISLEDVAEFDTDRMALILKLCEKVEYIPDPTTEDVMHGRRGCWLEVILKNGVVLKKEIVIPKGDPEAPLDWADMKRKYLLCVLPLIGEAKTEELFQLVSSLDECSRIERFVELLTR